MRVVVTGGAGFIGSHLVDALVARGDEVLVLDDLSHGSAANLTEALRRGARLDPIDIRDAVAVHDRLAGFGPEVVFHLAAQIDVRTSMAEPARDAQTNVLGSLNVFAAARAAGVRRVVNTSTGGAIYGEAATVPTPETEPARPLSAYGLSKRTAEEYGAWFGRAHGLDVLTLRYGNVYGPRQDHEGDAGVIAIFCERVLAGQAPTVHGDGRQTRDYVFVADIVAANLAAADAGPLPHPIYNVGTGVEVDILQLIDEVALAADVSPAESSVQFLPARDGEVQRSCLDVSLAQAELQLADPTPLAEGLRVTLDWVRPRHRRVHGTRRASDTTAALVAQNVGQPAEPLDRTRGSDVDHALAGNRTPPIAASSRSLT